MRAGFHCLVIDNPSENKGLPDNLAYMGIYKGHYDVFCTWYKVGS